MVIPTLRLMEGRRMDAFFGKSKPFEFVLNMEPF